VRSINAQLRCPAVSILIILLSSICSAQQVSIINSPHNLSASGPGTIRASSEQEVCIFCHTPHNSSPIQPLWNRNVPVNAYTVYSSNSLQAHPGQPTGSSKLCLSCHDGTIAVGSVLSRNQPIPMAGGITTLPPGHGNLGTDLSDDHPISFRYDSTLTAQDPKIKPPTMLPKQVRLDHNQEMQCTSCHDAHNNAFGNFLVMDNTQSELCSSCHQAGRTTIAEHTACSSCHAMHSAPSGALLLKGVNASEACLQCHSSSPNPLAQGTNVSADLVKISRHYQNPTRAPMTPDVGQTTSPRDTLTCSGCHEPHTMNAATASAPLLSPKLGEVSGINASGGVIPAAQYEYEVCFKCHQSLLPGKTAISRQLVQMNTRLEFAPSAVSFHPVEIAGKSTDVPSLRSNLTTASLIYCTDCHNSDTGTHAGASGPNGPHGSNETPLLKLRYETTDNTSESASAYALCYSCHDRASILSDQSYKGHQLHVVQQKTPCSVCHDAHGISSAQGNSMNHSHLINFDTSVVTPDPGTGKIEYRALGVQSGQCTLSCHGFTHSATMYPPAGGATPQAPAGLRVRRPTPTPPPRSPVPQRRPSK
jgi:predicted CXXCH cytochrome family protein